MKTLPRPPKTPAARAARAKVAALLAALCLAAGAARAAQPPAPPAAPAGAEPGVLVTRLENGMDVIVAERRAAPVCTVQIWVRCGSTTEEELLGSGVSHFVEHMLFKGTARRGVRQMDREIRAAGGGHNAYTSTDRTVYHATLPSSGFDVALDCLADAVMNSAFDAQECERERQVIVREIDQGEDSAGRTFWRHASGLLYLRHPRRHPVIGYRSVFEKVTREQLVDYYRRHYVPNNMIFVAAGDLDPAATVEKVRKAFAGFERRRHIAPRIPAEPAQAAPRALTVRDRHFENARIMLAWPTVDLASPDMYPLDMAALVLGDGRTSRLHRRLVDREKLVHSVSAGSYTPHDGPGYFEVQATLDERNVPRAIAAIEEELLGVLRGRIGKDEVARALARRHAREVFGRETVDGLAAGLAGDLFATGDAFFGRHYQARLAAVRPEELGPALARYLVPARRNQLTILPEKRPAAPGPEAPAPVPAAATTARVERFELPRGARLLVCERRDDPVAAVSAVFLGGVRFEPADRGGVSDMTAALLTRGTARRSAAQFDQALADRGASLSGYGGRNSFGVSGQFLSRDLELALQLTAEVLAEPGFPEDELDKRRELTLAGLRQSRRDIWRVNGDLLAEMLYAPHPYARRASGTEESVTALRRRDLVEFHRRFCRPENLVLSVAGDVSAREVHALTLRHFAKFLAPGEAAPEPPEVPAVPRLQLGRRQEQVRPEFKQALVTLAFRGVTLRDPDRFPLEVLRAALAGMGSRLFDELRDRQSLAYSVGCYLEQGLDPGAVVFYIATRPDQVDRAIAAFWKEIEKVKAEPLGEEELGRARNSVLGAQVRGRQRVSAVAQGTAYDELYGLGAANYFAEHREIEKVTAEAVLAAARRYLDSANYVVAVTRPDRPQPAPDAPPEDK